MTTNHSFTGVIYIIQVASTLMMTGLIWFVQVVHYPLFRNVDGNVFKTYELRHQILTSWVVIPLMTLELLSAFVLLWNRPQLFSRRKAWIGLVLLVSIWMSTLFLQAPQHDILASGFDVQAHATLIETNWIRTFCWSLRSLVIVTHLSTNHNY